MPFESNIDETTRLRERLESCERDTLRFLEMLVHDARTAQRGISTSAELLCAEFLGQSNQPAPQAMRHLQDGVAKMNMLLTGVSNYTMSLSAARYSFATVSMEIPLRLALSGLAANVRESGAVITHGTLPQVRGDMERLTALFRSLIGNSLLYRRPDPPRIEIEGRLDEAHSLFSVQDNGIGIARKYWDGLFEPFRRLHGPDIPGAGLGLATCRNVVQAHGGKIWIDSEVDRFTTIYFTLPAVVA